MAELFITTTTPLATATVGVAYSATTLAATGGTPAYTWAVFAGVLPNGLSLNTGTGAITGTPTVLGNWPVTFSVTDSAGAVAYLASIFPVSPQVLISDIASYVTTNMLKRTDMATVVQGFAQDVYRMVCAAVPFDELMITSQELPLVAQQTSYDLDAPGPTQVYPPLRAIQSIRITFDTNNKRRLRRSATRLYDSLSTIPFNRSATYARWGHAIELNPPPDSSAYTIRVRYWSRPDMSEGANTPILTPREWDELLKWETLYRAYFALDMQDRAFQLVQPVFPPKQPSGKKQRVFEAGIILRLWNDLLGTVSNKENTDEDFSINPLNRNYSARVGGGW